MTVHAQFEKTAEAFPENAYLYIPRQATADYSDDAVEFSYVQAGTEISKLREIYRLGGYGPGHRVALILDNRADFFLHFLALNSLGISVVPVNSGFTDDELTYVIDHSDARLVVVLPEYADKVKQAMTSIGSTVPVLPTTDLDHLPTSPDSPSSGNPDETTEAAVLYTSGTTGQPKGCMLSNDYFRCLGDWYLNVGGYCELEHGKERLLTPLPVTHMNAFCSMMGMIVSGGCIIQLDRFHPSTWWETVRDSKATCLHYLGVMPAILLSQPERPEDDFSDQIKFGFGAGCDPKHQERFEKRFGFPLVEGWAMTETGVHVCICANREPRHLGTRCIGRPFADIEYRLVDEEGNDVPPGEPGELLIRCQGEHPRKGFFSGYYKDPKATEEVWAGGYFHTGDVMRVDEDGLFYFVDRRKNIIRRSGENIAAVEVEGVLFQSQQVANCVATPVYDEMRGDEVGVCVVVHEGVSSNEETAEALFDFCSERLSYYKVPGYFMFVDALPMTASQKIQRGEVKKLAAQLLEEGRAIDLRDRKRKGNR